VSRVVQFRRVAEAIIKDLRKHAHEPGYKLPNVRDLAKKYDVSVFTLSKALDILETRGVIEKKWAVGCFLSSKAQRELQKDFKPTIGILLNSYKVPSTGWSEMMLQAVLEEIKAAGGEPSYVSWRPNAKIDPEVDGLLVPSTDFDTGKKDDGGESIGTWVRAHANSQFPIVTLDFDIPEAASVQIDNTGGMYQLAKYLVQLGHREIAYLGTRNSTTSDERLTGLRKALSEAGLEHSDELVWITTPSPWYAKREFPIRYAVRRFSAVCCFEDLSAAGVILAAREMGLNVPGDLSVAGFGNLPMGELAALPLTTLDVSPRELARQAVRLLVEMIRSGQFQPAKIRVPTQLLVRQSTGPVKAVTPAKA
jgi:DNA-binding LacI/PurR family transcriptional regulator